MIFYYIAFEISDMNDTIDKIRLLQRLTPFTYFIVLELNEKFASQIYLDEESKTRTAFKSPSGRQFFCYNTLPIGLKNTQSTVRRTCDRVLSENASLNDFAVRVGQKLILFATDPTQNEANFHHLSVRFSDYNLNMRNLDKRHDTELKIFDSVISRAILVPNPRKLTSIQFLKVFTSKEQLKLFQTFFSSFSSEQIPDYYALNSELERLAASDINNPSNSNALNNCFEQIKNRINSMIYPR